jgi:hypothetical protein
MIRKNNGQGFKLLLLAVVLLVFIPVNPQAVAKVTITNVDSGWAGNSVNAVVFRKNSLVTYRDTQFISFYNAKGFVVLGKRKTGENNWILAQTGLKGNIKDAHNSISMMADGDGYIHLAWDHHNNPLNYCRSKQPLSLEMGEKMDMSVASENSVSYPEFYKMPDGDLLFLYRDGGSGRGNLVINRYNVKTKLWIRMHNNLIDGEQKRNAYWQAAIGNNGVIHISWVWRESPDVASNHDMCYARSLDGGATWEKSTGERYNLPITAATAEYVLMIPQKSELINQTSMCIDEKGDPFIASYWREQGSMVPQYHIIYKKNNRWQVQNLDFRKTAFSLSGAGTKQIPISRPQILVWNKGKKIGAALLFKDEERGSVVSVAVNNNISKTDQWKIHDLGSASVGAWEPTYDTELWKRKGLISLFVQRVVQADAEGMTNTPPQMIQVLEWKPR